MVSGATELLVEQARIAKKECRLEEAAELFRKALEECGGKDLQALRATLYEELAYVERSLRDLDASQEHYRQGSEIFRSLGNPLKAAHTVRHAADILRELKKPDMAAALYGESLEIYRSDKDTPPLDLANAIRGFALLKEDAGDRKEALNQWREARGLYEQTGIEAGVAESDARVKSLSAD
jgi:tetratricopeptide (TPR) repeat protein